MKDSTKKTIGFGAGLTLAAVFGVVIGWGQLKRDVDVPRPIDPAGPTVLCIAGPEVDRKLLADAAAWWRERGHPVRIAAEPCDLEHPPVGHIPVWVNHALEAEGSGFALDGPFAGEPAKWGRVVGTWEVVGGALDVELQLHPGQSLTSNVHELGHLRGYDHPANAPSGHPMHGTNPGTKDDRGLRGP